MSRIDVKRLVKTYVMGGLSKHVLKDLSFEVHSGDFLAIMGPSGSGKSTLLYTMSGMDVMTSGEVFIEGESLGIKSEKEMAAMRLKSMGFVFQKSHFLKSLNVLDNICLPGFKAGEKPHKAIVSRAEALMTQMGIEAIKTHSIHKVSGGQLQRAAICRALINNPKLIFADEPTGALDSKASEEVMAILSALNAEKTTIVMVTHDAKVASRANRLIHLEDGQIKRID